MKIKESLAIPALLLALVFVPLSAWADDGIVRLYAGPARNSWSMVFDNNNPSVTKRGRTDKSNYTATNFGLTYAAAKGFYVDVSGQQSGSAHHDLWDSYTTQPQSFSHNSYSLTAGYSRVFEKGANMAFFGGYNSGTTTMNAPKGAKIPASLTTGFSCSPNCTVGWSKDTFESKGVFVGVGGGFPALGGRIGASGAIAYMSGTWKDDFGLDDKADYTFGYSIGANYTYKFNQALGITADLKYQIYNYNFNTTSTTTSAYTVDEKITSVGVRLSYQF